MTHFTPISGLRLLNKDLVQTPALLSLLFLAVGIFLGEKLAVAIPGGHKPYLLLLIPLLLLPFKWKPLLFVPMGLLLILSFNHHISHIDTSKKEYTLQFHTPPTYQRGSKYGQKVSTPDIHSPLYIELTEPLEPGQRLRCIAHYCPGEERLLVDSTVERVTAPHRNRIYHRIKNGLAQTNSPMSSYYYATVLREKYRISPRVEDIFYHSGLIHFMAISGLHIAVTGAIIYFLLWILPIPRLWQRLLASLFTIAVVLIIGPSPSTNRALTMYLCFALAPLLQRQNSYWNSLGVAGLLLLLYTPKDLFTVGFQLSFMATAGVLYALDYTKRVKQKALKVLCFSLLSTFLIFLLTTPLLLWHFHSYAPPSLLFNVLALPILSLTFGLLLISLLIFLIYPPLGTLLLKLVTTLDTVLLTTIENILLKSNMGAADILLPPVTILTLGLLIGTILLWIKRRVTTPAVWLMLITVSGLLLYDHYRTEPLPHQIKPIIIDDKSCGDQLLNEFSQARHGETLFHIFCKAEHKVYLRRLLSPFAMKNRFIITTLNKQRAGKPNQLHLQDTLQCNNREYLFESIDSVRIRYKYRERGDKDWQLYIYELD